MLRSNRSSSSLTPIETNTDGDYSLGYYDTPPMSNVSSDSRRSSREGNSTVQIRVMDSDRNEAQKLDLDDDGEKDDDDSGREKADDGNDDIENGVNVNWGHVERYENDRVDDNVSNLGEVKNDDRSGIITGDVDRAASPVEQRIERDRESNDEGILHRGGNDKDSSVQPDKDGSVDDGNADVRFEPNVGDEQNQRQLDPDGNGVEQGDRHDVVDGDQNMRNSINKPVDGMNSSGDSNNRDESNSSYQLETLQQENDDNVKKSVEKGQNQPNDNGEFVPDRENKDAARVPNESSKRDSRLDLSTQSGGVDNPKGMAEDVFDRKDSVEMSYFASFTELGSPNDKSTKAESKIPDTKDGEEGSQSTARLSLHKANGLETRGTRDDHRNLLDNLDKDLSIFCGSGDNTDNSTVPITPGHRLSESNTVKQTIADESAQDSRKDTSDAFWDTEQVSDNHANAECKDESSLQTKVDSDGKTPPRASGPGNAWIDNDGHGLSGNQDNAGLAGTNTTVPETPVSKENPERSKGGGENGDDSNNYDDDDDDDGDGGGGENKTDEFPPLSEPDEQSILRVYISRSEQEQNELDDASQILQSSEDAHNKDVDSPGKRNIKKSKSSTKLAKNNQKDKKKSQPSPYSNSVQAFKFDGDAKAIERLKQGPYAEVFKRDVPKVPTKSKSGQENTKKNKSNDKPKSQQIKKDNKPNAAVRSPSKAKSKSKSITLTNKTKLKEKASRDEMDASSFPSPLREYSEDESTELNEAESNEDNISANEKKFETKRPNVQRTVRDNQDKPFGPGCDTAGEDDISTGGTGVQDKTLEPQQCVVEPQTTTGKTLPSVGDEDTSKSQPRDTGPEQSLESAAHESTTDEALEGNADSITLSNDGQSKENGIVDVVAVDDIPPQMSPSDSKTPAPNAASAEVDNRTRQNPKTPTEIDTKTTGQESKIIIETEMKPTSDEDTKSTETKDTNSVDSKSADQATDDVDNKSNPEKETKVAANKNTSANTDKQNPPPLRGSSAKKKIIISSPKTTAKMAAKSKQISEKNKNSNKTQSTKVTPKSDKKTKERKTSDVKKPSNDSNSNQMDVVEPATITVIDETSELDEKVNGRAGRLIINNIKNKLKKNSIKRHASNSSVASVQLITTSRPSSPDDKGLNASIPHQGGRTAYKTQSMSSLQVPGHLSTSNPWDATKEEDAVSIGSRRPSMDSVSRKSVDYRIRNTTMVIQPNNDEKPKSVFTSDDTYIQNAVPCLPMSLAVFCLLLNVVVPGSGTIISGLSVLCCGHSRLSSKEDQMLNSLCANVFVGIAQLFTVSFMLVGWFWSVSWGIKMVSVSAKHREEQRQQREKDLQAMALSAFGSPKRMNLFSA